MLTQTLDPETAATITRTEKPLILARDHSGAAAYARDFAYIGVMQVNSTGRYRYFLWLGLWSSAPDSRDSLGAAISDSIILTLDGNPLLLESRGSTPAAFGGSEPVFAKPLASALDQYFEVTLDQVELLAAADDIRLGVGTPVKLVFEKWDEQKAAVDSIRRLVNYSETNRLPD